MKLEDIRITKQPLYRATDSEVNAAEASLDVRFPSGYRAYVTALGEGCLEAGGSIRVFPPWRILYGKLNDREWKEFVQEYWFWDESPEVLTRARASASIIVGDTVSGNALIFLPEEPDWLYVLPHEEERVYKIGPGLFEALDWLCKTGVLAEPAEELRFDPFDSRKG